MGHRGCSGQDSTPRDMVPVDTCHYTLVQTCRMSSPGVTVMCPCGSSTVGNVLSGGGTGSRGGCAWGWGQELYLNSLYLFSVSVNPNY